nr:proline-rich proteoglycan 2-like [Equus asinus]
MLFAKRGAKPQHPPRRATPPPPEPAGPSSLPFPGGKRAGRPGRRRRRRGHGREEGGGPDGGEAGAPRRARLQSARGGRRRRRRRRAQGQGMADAPSACAYVRESGRGRERAEPGCPPLALSLGSALPRAPHGPRLLPPAPHLPPPPPRPLCPPPSVPGAGGPRCKFIQGLAVRGSSLDGTTLGSGSERNSTLYKF